MPIRSPWLRHGVVVAFVAVLAVALVRGLLMDRVHHGDELWSLDVMRKSYDEVVAFILGSDNHPPLYYLVAKAWAGVSGFTVASVRRLSYVFAILTLASFGWFHCRYRSIPFFAPLLLLASNPLFTYYGATIRPYAMSVFLASLLILSALVLRRHPLPWRQGQSRGYSQPRERRERFVLQGVFYGSGLLLGLTHYYGTLLVVILLIWDFFERRISASRLAGVILLSLLMVWPLLQMSFGSLDQQIEANRWVHVVPMLSSFNNLMMAVFPVQILSKRSYYLFSLGLLFVVFACLLSSHVRAYSWRSAIVKCWRSNRDVIYLLMPIGVIYLCSAMADLYKPFSTPYYFLVCLPACAVLFGWMVGSLRRRFGALPALVFVATVVVAQVVLAQARLSAP